MLLLMLMLADDMGALMQSARDRTAAEHRCVATADTTDITVCGLRHADRYRVPFVVHDPGDPRHEGVSAERNRLLARTDNCQEKRAIQVGCGFAGVHMTTGGNGTSVGGMRKLAP
ncbi:hypothetical protein [Sphingomonas mollis]|uniref:Secreted protein n=1 Tax=Sphingomonas mollis TaxID=2795726 RepID=A0ABS0XJX0_9SPHN|nr:hypothetical protein [Sphingomonas sp. BT553]MBJ6120334.1 hypothetical protein [Sphingomonas sp. BT553]